MTLEILTALLVGITGYYAWQTRAIVQVSREMAEATREAADLADRRRQRDKSDEAARLCFRSLAAFDAQVRRGGAGNVTREELRQLHEALSTEGVVIADRELRDRVASCAAVAFTAGWDEESMRRSGMSPGLAVLVLNNIGQTTRWSLAAFLREDPLPSWQDFPTPGEAQAWAQRESKSQNV